MAILAVDHHHHHHHRHHRHQQLLLLLLQRTDLLYLMCTSSNDDTCYERMSYVQAMLARKVHVAASLNSSPRIRQRPKTSMTSAPATPLLPTRHASQHPSLQVSLTFSKPKGKPKNSIPFPSGTPCLIPVDFYRMPYKIRITI